MSNKLSMEAESAGPKTASPLAEKFIPRAEVLKTHEIIIDAPAHIVFEVAELFDMQTIPTIRFLFRLRETLLRIQRKPRRGYQTLVSETKRLGWIKLASRPGRELAMGAIARPGIGNIEFLQLGPEGFAAFTEPGFVKVVWTLEAEPVEAHITRFRTQTRVVATDARARSKFRLYWIFAGKLVSMIRILSLRAIRKEAERRLI